MKRTHLTPIHSTGVSNFTHAPVSVRAEPCDVPAPPPWRSHAMDTALFGAPDADPDWLPKEETKE